MTVSALRSLVLSLTGPLLLFKPIRFRAPTKVPPATDQEPESSDTIAGLAQKLGLNPAETEKTVQDFNAAVDSSTPFDLMTQDGKATHGLSPNKTNWANKIETPPFYGYPMTANLTFTYGGVKTNLEGRVVSAEDVPIPGLWAAGEMTGLFINEYPPATSVLRSLTVSCPDFCSASPVSHVQPCEESV